MQRTPTFRQAPTLDQMSRTPSLGQKCIAEFLGTAFLIYIGCGTLTATAAFLHGRPLFAISDLFAASLAFGLALAIMVYAIGHISNCHINPAVTIGLACVRRISWEEAGAYIIAQLVGAFVGALLVAVTFGAASAGPLGYGASDYNPAFVNYFGAIVVEAITTFFLVFVVMATAIDKRAPKGWAGFAIGLTLAMGMLVAGSVTGGNLNPARAFGPTIVQMIFGNNYPFGHMFVYFIGPIIGGILGAFAYQYLARPHAEEEPAATTTYKRTEPGY